ncbi:MAG: SURF1 family protein [Rhizobiaceae bacterium]
MSAAALAVFAALMALGTWQVRRLAWKEALIATIEARIHQPPRPFETWYKTEPGTDYWPVTVSGTFRHQSERHFFATHQGASGYYVYTPLETAPNAFLFVNRGFVPFDRKDPATRNEGQTAGQVTIEGFARPVLTEKPSTQVPDNDPSKNIFYWKDLAAMKSSAGLPQGATVIDAFVDADAAATPQSGLPQGGVTIVNLPNNHLQYAVTWYGLAAALTAIWGVLAWRQFGRKT